MYGEEHVWMHNTCDASVMVWGNIFCWHTLCPVVPAEHCLNDTGFLSTAAGPVHLFMAQMYTDSRLQQYNMLCYKAHIISNWFFVAFTVLKWPPESKLLLKKNWDYIDLFCVFLKLRGPN